MTQTLELRNKDYWKRYVELDPVSGEYELHERADDELPPSRRVPADRYPSGDEIADGWYQILDGHWVGFYRYEGKIHLRIDDDAWALDESATVEWQKGEEQNKLIVSSPDGELVHFEYTPAWHNVQDWWTPNASPEDYDITISLSNLWNKKKRREWFLGLRPDPN